MAYDVANNMAQISGNSGVYGNNAKKAEYGKNAANNYLQYINDFKSASKPVNPDVFTKSHSVEEMYGEIQKAFEEDKMPPVNFLLQYAPKTGAIKGFFTKLFGGFNVNKQALMGFTYEAMGQKKAMTLEEADKDLNEAFSGITDAKLTAKAFDVNGDGMIDMSEEAVSTVLADVLSKDESDGVQISKKDLKKADGTYTNLGEDKILAFCNEKNLETASEVVKEIHSKLKLDKAEEKFAKTLK